MLNCEITVDRFKKHPVGNYNRVTLFPYPLSTLKITSSEFVYRAVNETSDVGPGTWAPKEERARFLLACLTAGAGLLPGTHPKYVKVRAFQ